MPNRSLVLIKFRDASDALEFYRLFNGKPFSAMEPEICHVVNIKSNVIKSTVTPPFTFPFLQGIDPFAGTYSDGTVETRARSNELPTCPVCLERMDHEVTGLVTIL